MENLKITIYTGDDDLALIELNIKKILLSFSAVKEVIVDEVVVDKKLKYESVIVFADKKFKIKNKDILSDLRFLKNPNFEKHIKCF